MMKEDRLIDEIELYKHLKWMMEREVKLIYKSGLMNGLDEPMSTRIEGWAEGIRYAVDKIDYQIKIRAEKLLDGVIDE